MFLVTAAAIAAAIALEAVIAPRIALVHAILWLGAVLGMLWLFWRAEEWEPPDDSQEEITPVEEAPDADAVGKDVIRLRRVA